MHKKETLKETLQRRRDKLLPEKLALLQKRLQAGVHEAELYTASIPRRLRNKRAPLTFSQARLWFLFEWDPDSPTYNEAFATRIKGVLDLKAFERAFLVLDSVTR